MLHNNILEQWHSTVNRIHMLTSEYKNNFALYKKNQMKCRAEKLPDKMFEEVEKSEKRYRHLQENYTAEKKNLHVLLQEEQEKLVGCLNGPRVDFEKAEQLIADYENACHKIQELKDFAAAREAEAERKMSLTKLDLEKRVQEADLNYKTLEGKYCELRSTSSLNINSLYQEVDVIKGQSEEQLQAKQNCINDLQHRLNESEEERAAINKIAENSKLQLKNKDIELAGIVECLKETYETFLRQKDRIEQLENESKENHEIIENLKLQVREMKTASELSEKKVTELEGKIREKSDESIEKMNMMQKRLDFAETSTRQNVEEKEKLTQMLRDRDLMIENMKAVYNEVLQTSQDEVKRLKQDTLDRIAKSKLDRELMEEKLESKDRLLRKILPKVQLNLQEVRFEMDDIRSQVKNIPFFVEEYYKKSINKMSERLTETNEMYNTMLQRCRKEMQIRQKLHVELIQLRGNIRVFVRIRPHIPSDPQPLSSIVNYDPKDNSVVRVDHRGRNLNYTVDQVFGPQSTQEDVFKEIKSLITSCMDGYNVCIFAYGQTGSGKTYTMEGIDENPGINQRALCDMFTAIEQRSYQWDHQVTVSLLEIYNEKLRDLLSNSSEKLDIRMNQDKTLRVSPLQARVVQTIAEVNEVLNVGRKNRVTACTNLNEHSSRSHGVLIVNVAACHKIDGRKTLSRLNLIDLAGSERVSRSCAAGDRLKEAQNINRSLSALGDVIQAIRNKKPHVPFRNSKLTYLLQDSLSKNSRTLMVVQVSPHLCNASETVCSLTFAQRIKLWNWV